jgi:sugar transferase (PEP-CTERM/EpsH1 system associated)
MWLKSELLHPLDKGGRIRTYQMLKHLSRQHDVTYLALASPTRDQAAIRQAGEYCRRLITVPFVDRGKTSPRFYRDLLFNLGSPLPYAIEKYASNLMRREIERELHARCYDLVVCDFLVPSINLPRPCQCATILFQHNVESVIWRRRYERQAGRLRKKYFARQWEAMLAYERAACRTFDAVVAVSDVDREFMRTEYRLDHVYDVPTGVDTNYFRPPEGNVNRAELVFTGSMDWMANEDAIVHFVRNVLPRITASAPEARLTVAGRNPSARVRSLSRAGSRVTVTGSVADIRPYVARAGVYVVPLRIGGGTRLKIFEAMAMGKAIVSTAIGAEGLPVQHGRELLVADAPREFADAVITLIGGGDLAERIGERARSAVCERFGWERAAAAFGDICERVVSARARSHAA